MPLGWLTGLIAPPLCVGCGGHAGRLEPLCGSCRAGLRWLGPEPAEAAGVPVWSPLAYDGAVRAVVAALKFRGALRLADPMAAHMAANAPPGWLDRGVLVPVPLDPGRLRRRGFNQAAQLARAVGERAGLPSVDCLERSTREGTQVGRGRSERLARLERSITVAPGGMGAPAEAVLVDDVVTTGGTLGACAEALRRAGVTEVRAITYARTPGR